MKLLGRIASLVVIVVGLATVYFAHQLKLQLGVLRHENTNLSASLTVTTNNLLKTEATLRDTATSLTTTTNKLIATEASLDATNKVLVATAEERDKAKADLAPITQQLQAANTEIASMKESLKKAEESVAAVEKAQVAKMDDYKKQIEVLTQESKVLASNLEAARTDVKRLAAENEDLRITPVNTRGKIAAVEERWDFAVLDIGQNQKVSRNTEFLVYRQNKFICKILTVSVSPNTAVAQILPEFQKDDPRPGDIVIH